MASIMYFFAQLLKFKFHILSQKNFMQNLATKLRPSSSIGKQEKTKKGKYSFLFMLTLSDLIRLLSVSGPLR